MLRRRCLAQLLSQAYFGQFGEMEDVVAITEGISRRPRGFGFITYVDVAAADAVLQTRFHVVANRYIEVKQAVPRAVTEVVHPHGTAGETSKAAPIAKSARALPSTAAPSAPSHTGALRRPSFAPMGVGSSMMAGAVPPGTSPPVPPWMRNLPEMRPPMLAPNAMPQTLPPGAVPELMGPDGVWTGEPQWMPPLGTHLQPPPMFGGAGAFGGARMPAMPAAASGAAFELWLQGQQLLLQQQQQFQQQWALQQWQLQQWQQWQQRQQQQQVLMQYQLQQAGIPSARIGRAPSSPPADTLSVPPSALPGTTAQQHGEGALAAWRGPPASTAAPVFPPLPVTAPVAAVQRYQSACARAPSSTRAESSAPSSVISLNSNSNSSLNSSTDELQSAASTCNSSACNSDLRGIAEAIESLSVGDESSSGERSTS
jgi:hypothetical protein